MILVGLDTETKLIRPYHFTPELVCCAIALRDQESPSTDVGTDLRHRKDPGLPGVLAELLEEQDCHFIGANIGFDMRVLVEAFPDLWTLVWNAYFEGRVHDVLIREKLYVLSTTGDTEYGRNPDGTSFRRLWNLAEIERLRLGIDRRDEKKSADAWRLRYGELYDTPIEKWPEEAVSYAKQDAVNPIGIYLSQEEDRKPRGHYGSIETGPFQAAADFALGVFSSWGLPTDPARVALLAEHLEEILSAERMTPLYEAGILRPAVAPRPYKGNPEKFTKGKPESKNLKKLRELVQQRCKELAIKLTLTKTKKVSTDADIIQQIAEAEGGEGSIFALLAERESYIKLRSTYLPVLQHPRVWFPFNVLVRSGRTSSRSDDNLPSTNGQNQPTLSGDFATRECFVADPGHLLCAVDYSTLELCTLAQTVYNLFGKSSHRDLINRGVDLHAFLGSQLARYMDPTFAAICDQKDYDQEQAYEAFLRFKSSEDEDLRKFFGHWRKLAKPTGLGYPGGLGPATFVKYARSSYGVEVDFATSENARNVWYRTFPEMRDYFDYCNAQIDERNEKVNPDDPEDRRTLYMYCSPKGMLRCGAGFTEVANGLGLQTPSAEGAKTAVISVARACTDITTAQVIGLGQARELYGCRAVLFVHDEIIVSIPDDERRHERAMAIGDIMVSCMKTITPDVTIRVEPSLMRRWSKRAEPVYDEAGRLAVWEAEE